MELHAAKESKCIVFLYETLGTFFLIYAINLTTQMPYGVWGIAMTLFLWLLIGGPITGAHYNPAVSIGVLICNKHWRNDIDIFMIMLFGQFFGAFFGCFFANISLISWNPNVERTGMGVPIVSQATLHPNMLASNWFNVFVIEMIVTAIFVKINLLVKTRRTSPTTDGFLGCMAIAFTLLSCICVSADKTGACLNPAIGFA